MPANAVKLQNMMTHPDVKRRQVRQSVITALEALFPIESTQYILDAKELRVQERLYSSAQQKTAVLDGRSLSEPIKARVTLKDKRTGEVIDEKGNYTLMQLPWMTPRHTFTVDGNEYSVANQPRIKPGIYTRTRANKEIESAFNLARGKNFRLSLQPDTGKFYLELGSTKIPLYNVMKALGASMAELDQHWGRELHNVNVEFFARHQQKSVGRLYEKLVPRPKKGLSMDKQIVAINEYLGVTKMDPEVNETTLGNPFSEVNKDVLLKASQKLLHVYQGTAEEDDRDSLEFKSMHSVENHFAERVRLKGRDVVNKVKFKMNFSKGPPSVSAFLTVGAFSKVIRTFVTNASLSAQPTQINPVEIIDYAVKVTPLGEGGIENERVIPNEARETHATQFGILDPIKTPESSHAGVDVRAAMLAAKDEKGNMYTPLYDLRKGRLKHVSAKELKGSVVAFPMQKIKPHKGLSEAELNRVVEVLNKGTVGKAKVRDVDYYLDHPAKMYGPNTNLIPAIDGIQGNRAIMGAKMVGQAVPLKDAEAPLVQVQSYVPGKSHEQIMADMVNPTSTVDGEVVDVDDAFITVKDSAGKEHKIGFYDHFPLASKTYLHDTPIVKVGDKVKKGDHLAESIYTRDKTLAIGKNLDVAYLAYNGLNSNDAVVISESASQKFTSLHMYKHHMPLDKQVTLDKDKFASHYPTKYSLDQLKNLDDDGVITPGKRLESGDPWLVALRETKPSAEDIMLGRLHKGLIRKYRDESKTWVRDYPGTVVDVSRTAKKVTITVKVEAPMKVGDKCCFDEKHELLTAERGWVPVTDLAVSDTYASISEEGMIEWVPAEATHEYPVENEPMYTLNTTQVSMSVTDEHKLWASTRKGGVYTGYSLVEASELEGKRYRLAMSGKWEGRISTKEVRIGDKLYTIPQYLMLLGMFLSEGNTFSHVPSGSYGVDIHQVKPHTRAKMFEALSAAGIKYSKTPTRVRIYSKALMEHFKPLGKCYDKYIPRWVLDLPSDQLEVLYTWLMWGDGSETTTGHNYCTTSKQLASDFQVLCLLTGRAGKIDTIPAGEKLAFGKIVQAAEVYYVRVYRNKLCPTINHGHASSQKGQREVRGEYTGRVYCVELERNHTLYTRREGKVHWSGNSNRYGGKGVVSKILPDNQMPQRETGTPIDVMVTSASVVSRINPAQIVETAIAKAVKKQGKVHKFQNFSTKDNTQLAREMMEEAGVSDKERVYDPVEDKWIDNVFVGPQYMLKLFKSTDTNFSARSIGGYDPHEQPGHGGVEGAKSLGGMEVNAMLAHNARGLLQEASIIKSQKNADFWRAVQLGLPTPPPRTTFAYNKFLAMLKGAGVRVDRQGDKMVMSPLTDDDVTRMSAGKILNPRMVRAKDLYPERGGLFDEVITGGSRGTRWSHIDLAEPMVNPMFEEPARRLLGLKQKEFREEVLRGGEQLKKQLNALDLKKEEKELRERLRTAKGAIRNDVVKRLKYIASLKKVGLKAGDAYVLSKIPVLPPVMRPITPSKSGDLMIDDPNYLYRDLMLASDSIREAKDAMLPEVDVRAARSHTYESLKASVGLADPVSPQLAAKNVRGFVKNIAGRNPKQGYFQSKLISKPQDLTGRGTAAPDPSLGLDEIGLPEDIAWKQYANFTIRRLVRSGYTAARARELLEDKAYPARQALEAEVKERPIIYNRAPSLWRYSVVAAYPKLVKGKTIKVNPLVENGMNLDYDGDALQLHLPATDKGVADAKKMTLSNLLFSDKKKNDLLVFPQHEAIIGIFQATAAKTTGKKRTFKSKKEAWAAYKAGELDLGDEVMVG